MANYETQLFSYRLQVALNQAQIKPAELSRKTGISESLISCYCKGLYMPKTKRLLLIAEALGVRAVWLAFGEGSIK